MLVTKRNSTIVMVLAGTFFAGFAEARPGTRSFTCEGVRDYIQDRGAVVMNTKSANVYRRFVANRSFCPHGQITKRYSVPTKTGRCSLRICVDYDLDDDLIRRR